MSDCVTDWGTSMQDLTNGTFDWNTFMPELEDDTIDWSNPVNFDAPAGSRPSLSAAYDAQGRSELDIGDARMITGTTSPATTYPQGAGSNTSTAFHHDYSSPHSDERSFADHAAALDECTNEASYQICGTNLLATKRDLVPGQNAGLLDRIPSPETGADVGAAPHPAAQYYGDPEFCNEGPNPLDARNTDAGLDSDNRCKCIVCLDIGKTWIEHKAGRVRGYNDFCRVAGCKYSTSAPCFDRCPEDDHSHFSDALYWHEQDHFNYAGHFRCIEVDCSYSTKRWVDLMRHYTSKHCVGPKTRFPCPELSCNYSGEKGFLRKDKMKSHYRTVHGGNVKPGKRNQAIAPKIGSAA